MEPRRGLVLVTCILTSSLHTTCTSCHAPLIKAFPEVNIYIDFASENACLFPPAICFLFKAALQAFATNFLIPFYWNFCEHQNLQIKMLINWMRGAGHNLDCQLKSCGRYTEGAGRCAGGEQGEQMWAPVKVRRQLNCRARFSNCHVMSCLHCLVS